MKTRKTFRFAVTPAWLTALLLFVLPLNAQVFEADSAQKTNIPLETSNAMNRFRSNAVINDNLKNYYHNNHFRTAVAIRDSAFRKTTWYDTAIARALLEEEILPTLNMADFVYFNPLEYFQHPFKIPITEKRKLFSQQRKTIRGRNYLGDLPVPYALRFYLDTSHIRVVPGQTRLYLSSEAELLPEPFLRPFYFRKYLVTNAEYREFVDYVKDSIARTLLYEGGLTRYGTMVQVTDSTGVVTYTLVLNSSEPIVWDDPITDSLLAGIYIPEHRRHFRRKEIDPGILVYRFSTSDGHSDTLAIYPDTSAWMRDFHYGFMEPWTRNYFWHPAYRHYPVVGVSYWQAMAYLDWKTRMHQQALDKKGVRFRVVYELPSEAEWDIVATAAHTNGVPALYPEYYHEVADRSWITNLQLIDNWIERQDSTVEKIEYITERRNSLVESLTDAFAPRYVFMMDDHIFTHPARPEPGNRRMAKRFHRSERDRLLSRADPNGIYDMGGNVSEWLSDTYADQWLPVFTLRQEMMATFSDPDMLLLANLEQYYNSMNDTNGRLVRGTNWLDRRYVYQFGKNIAGMQAKRFVSPDKTYSTLGFRYVMRLDAMDD